MFGANYWGCSFSNLLANCCPVMYWFVRTAMSKVIRGFAVKLVAQINWIDYSKYFRFFFLVHCYLKV